MPCMLVAFAPPGSTTKDRCKVQAPFTVGRSSGLELSIADKKVSKRHFHITCADNDFWIEDMGSTNGTFVAGSKLTSRQKLSSPEVIRVGQQVLVFHAEGGSLLQPVPGDRFGLIGDFHIGSLIKNIRAATLSDRHVLLGGPSGSGKELISKAIASMMKNGKERFPVIAHNAARFSSEEEATATLFGVAKGAFSNVSPRPGLIEQAHGGVLFLDEIHNLPERVQRSLLRIVEDGKYARIGETKPRSIDIRFILASNESPPSYSISHDLLARLRTVRVPSLKERVADIPSIFDHLLQKTFERFNLDLQSIKNLLSGDHYEALCLNGFPKDNVRGIVDVADKLATHIAAGIDPVEALANVFFERFSDGPVARRHGRSALDKFPAVSEQDPEEELESLSHYEKNKKLIIQIIKECSGNILAAKRELQARGINCSDRWLRTYCDKWGVPRQRKRR